jgi:hypothetical protein
MRPLMHGDVVAAARVIFAIPGPLRKAELARLLFRTERADVFRMETGRPHPFWGDGSLMSAALINAPPPEPRLDDLDFCSCLAMVFEAIVDMRPNSKLSPAHRRRTSGMSDRAGGV